MPVCHILKDYGTRITMRWICGGGGGAGAGVCSAAGSGDRRSAGFSPRNFLPGRGAVEQLPPDARILAPDKFGGYLIYRFAKKRKVFFDGRSDFYVQGS